VWAGEFGRTPHAPGRDGRDHHPEGFSVWLAGGGAKGGTAYGATDEMGVNAVESVVTMHDFHATILHLLGIDHERLTYRFGGRATSSEACMSEQPRPVIRFYSTTGEHGCFSNFSRHAVFLKGKRWPTSEHFFQAQKFSGTKHEEAVRLCKTPRAAADMGRSRKLPLRRDWESVKDQVMLEAVRAKFSQHDDLRALLLGTGDAVLVERAANDSYWGDGGDGSGRNRLGQILMSVRDELRAAEQKA
jgi:ribA/ribD-fused uncharacterized protein